MRRIGSRAGVADGGRWPLRLPINDSHGESHGSGPPHPLRSGRPGHTALPAGHARSARVRREPAQKVWSLGFLWRQPMPGRGGGRRGAEAGDKGTATPQPEAPRQVSFPSPLGWRQSRERQSPGENLRASPPRSPPARMVRPAGGGGSGPAAPNWSRNQPQGWSFHRGSWGTARWGEKQGAILESLTFPGKGERDEGGRIGVDQVREERGG